ncbi:hypothetical protein [Nocardioides pacificus]
MPNTNGGRARRTPDRPTGGDASAAELWEAVLQAREVLAHERTQPRSSSATEARVTLLHALEAYVDHLERHRRPIPYAIRDELRLQRLTSS